MQWIFWFYPTKVLFCTLTLFRVSYQLVALSFPSPLLSIINSSSSSSFLGKKIPEFSQFCSWSVCLRPESFHFSAQSCNLYFYKTEFWSFLHFSFVPFCSNSWSLNWVLLIICLNWLNNCGFCSIVRLGSENWFSRAGN